MNWDRESIKALRTRKGLTQMELNGIKLVSSHPDQSSHNGQGFGIRKP